MSKKESFVYNYHRLRREIVYKYGTLEKFAREVLNITPVYFSRILASKAEYSQRFMDLTIQALDLDQTSVCSYFFSHEVS